MHAEELYDLALKCVAGTVIFSQQVPAELYTKPVHDGIGGRDTNNLLGGCLGMILGIIGMIAGGIIVAVGLAPNGLWCLIYSGAGAEPRGCSGLRTFRTG